ncbi:MAG: PQQ-binding-like beta-propeller repeat protein [Chloracidobacterium sp.]|nr:PQQ-binding-like beta-propeller repeat protein [Chloracidobacterium sp.]MDW8217382.1 PQQ-binding-like beta-propeller repeat protein [Acidobacteriota bacterium]
MTDCSRRQLICGLAGLAAEMSVAGAQRRPRLRVTTVLNGRASVPLVTLPTEWLYLDPDGARREPLATETAVYVPLRSGKVVALVQRDGARLWETAPGVATTGALARLGERLIACATRPVADGVTGPVGIVRFLDAATGVVRREIELPSPITSPLVGDGVRLYARLGTTEAAAFRPDDFSLLWQVTGDFTEHLTCDGDGVLVGTRSGALWRLRAADGGRQWGCTLGGAPGPATGDAEQVYCGTAQGEVVAIRRADGRIRWRRRVGGTVAAPPLIDRERVLIASYDNFLYAFAGRTGVMLWRQQMAGRLATPPVRLTEDSVAVAALDDDEITIVSSVDGRIIARRRLASERVFSALHLAGGLVIAATERGVVAAKLL